MTDNKSVMVAISRDTRDRLKVRAAKEKRTIRAIIEGLLARYLGKGEK